MDSNIIGRAEHILEMNEVYASKRPEFLALVGRRRIGKTFLIESVYKDKIDFALMGLHKGKKKQQFQNFFLMMEQYFPSYVFAQKPKDWMTAFLELSKALEQKAKTEKMVVFIDELPWLATKRSDFLVGLTWFWNVWATKQFVVLIVCGSSASWMIDKVINDKGGLHNRVTKQIKLEPFNLYETEAFLASRNIKLNRFQISQIYMTIGGIPMYLNLLKPGLSAIQNIQALCFDAGGFLKTEFDRLFSSLFYKYDNHILVVEALASKKSGMSRVQIIAKSKISNGGMLTKILSELKHSGFIEEYGSFGKIQQGSLYRLVDAYSLFYITYMRKISKTNNFSITNFSDLPSWKAWTGFAFENLCFMHIHQLKMALSISGMATSVASFIASPKDGLPGAQIDMLIDRKDSTINVCEMKYANNTYAITKADIANIDLKKQVFAYHSKTKKHLFTTIISTHPLADNDYKLNDVDQVVLLDELFIDKKRP